MTESHLNNTATLYSKQLVEEAYILHLESFAHILVSHTLQTVKLKYK